MALAGTQGRGGINYRQSTVYRHAYKGVYFYSGTGKPLTPKLQQQIVSAADGVPDAVWSKLASAKAKIVVQEWDDRSLAPTLQQHLRNLGVPRNAWNDVGSGKDFMFGGKGTPVVAIVGIGQMPGFWRKQDDVSSVQERRPHVLTHETAHAADHTLNFVNKIGQLYLKNFGEGPILSALKTAKPARQMQQNLEKTAISKSPAFRATIPKNYSAGYGIAAQSYMKGTPPMEVFAEALAHYWRGEIVPPKMQTFFDSHPDLSRGGLLQTTPVVRQDRTGQRPPK